MLEFAIAWPVCLLLVAGSIQFSIWGAESYSARQAALAGVRAGSRAGAGPETAQAVALAGLGRSLVGAGVEPWCPGSTLPPPGVWVCATAAGGQVEVRVGGTVPALFGILPGGRGLPIAADATLRQEAYQP